MTRGRTKLGRERASTRALLELPSGRPLIQAVDHGPGVRLDAADLGASGDRWVEPFLEANGAHLKRLGVATSVETRGGVSVRLTPGSRLTCLAIFGPRVA